MNITDTEEYKVAYQLLSDKMDKQQAFFDELWAFADKNGTDKMPPEYKVQWLTCQLSGRGPWRKNRAIVRRIQKTAKKAARNAIKNPRFKSH